jgi:hypothetical protein
VNCFRVNFKISSQVKGSNDNSSRAIAFFSKKILPLFFLSSHLSLYAKIGTPKEGAVCLRVVHQFQKPQKCSMLPYFIYVNDIYVS